MLVSICTNGCNMKTLNLAHQIRVYESRDMNSRYCRYCPEYIPRASLCKEKCVFSVTHEINF